MKKFLAILLGILMMTALCACGQEAVSTQESGAGWEEQLNLGNRYMDEMDYEAAIAAFTAAIEIDPNQALSYVGRGNAYILSGETEENMALALADYEAAKSLDDSVPGIYLGLADIHIRQGNYDSALEVLEEGLEKTGESQEIADKIAEVRSGNIKDSRGNIRRRSGYDGSGNLAWYHEFTYDAQGRMASVTSYDSIGNQTGYVETSFREDGNSLVSYWYAESGGEVGRIERTYDEAGNAVRTDHYSTDGSLSQYQINQYNENGNLIQVDRYSGAEGEWYSMEQYEYNAAGQIIRRDEYGDDDVLIRYYLYSYNEQGQRSSDECYDADGSLRNRTIYKYDDAGNHIGYDRYDGDGNLTHSVVEG